MSTFTVQHAAKKKDVEGRNGPMQVISLMLSGEGMDPVAAEWFTKASTQLPAPGSQLEGDLEDGQYGKKFKKAQQGGGFGGGRQRDPATEKRITRQHSQDMGIQTLRLALELGVQTPFTDVKGIVAAVKKLADTYDKDAWEAGS